LTGGQGRGGRKIGREVKEEVKKGGNVTVCYGRE